MVHVSSDLVSRYYRFIEAVDKSNVPPPKVYEPLTSKQLSDLKLIREVSAVLQKTKDEEELKKAMAAENEAEAQDTNEEIKEKSNEEKTE